jgi:DNA-binding response OmpR family regulator
MSQQPDAAARGALRESKPTQRILIVEDEEALALGVRDALLHAGFQAEVCHNGEAALDRLQRESFDLVVLDLMLPQVNGFDVLAKLRAENHRVRVVILTALSKEEDVLRGFEHGADDYVPKPFSPRELVARVQAQFRRQAKDSAAPSMLELPAGIRVDLSRLEVHREGKIVPLTPREGDILEYLIKNRERVVTREDLLSDVWHYKNPNVATRTVDIHIVGLRRKVEPDAANPTMIQTVRGKGYRWFS